MLGLLVFSGIFFGSQKDKKTTIKSAYLGSYSVTPEQVDLVIFFFYFCFLNPRN